METEREGLELTWLQVEVDSESDDRGILGMDPDTTPGPSSISIRIQARADGANPAVLRTVVERGAERCPVCDAAKRAMTVAVEVTVGAAD